MADSNPEKKFRNGVDGHKEHATFLPESNAGIRDKTKKAQLLRGFCEQNLRHQEVTKISTGATERCRSGSGPLFKMRLLSFPFGGSRNFFLR
jgi:hypothetical protein